MKINQSKKAQIAITDLSFAVILFIIFLIAFFVQFNNMQQRLADSINFENLELASIQITETLVKNPGTPTNWENNPTNVRVIGLASSDRILSKTKIEALQNLSYEQIKQGMNIEDKEFYLLIRNNENVFLELGNTTFKSAATIHRIVTYENQEATLDLSLWKN